MDRCESWTIKKAKHWRIDAFELWYWRRLFRVPWTARRSSQSMLEKINTEYSLEGLLLKLQYFGHLMRGADSLEKTLMLGKTEGRRRRGWQRMRWQHRLNGHQSEQTLGDSEGHGLPWWLRWWSVCLQCGRPRFNPWVGNVLWRRKWQPIPVLLPGKSHGQRSVVGYRPWGRKDSDTTERLHFSTSPDHMDIDILSLSVNALC